MLIKKWTVRLLAVLVFAGSLALRSGAAAHRCHLS